MVRMRMLLTALALLALGSGVAQAELYMFYDAEMVPELVQAGGGEQAYGQSTIIVNETDGTFTLALNFAGLESAQIGASLLRAAPDEVGVVLMDLPLGSPVAMMDVLPADVADALAHDELAIQIYTVNNPDGAIRGNYRFVTVNVDVTTWTRVKDLFN